MRVRDVDTPHYFQQTLLRLKLRPPWSLDTFLRFYVLCYEYSYGE